MAINGGEKLINLNGILQEALQQFKSGRFDVSRQLLESVLEKDANNQPSLWGLVKVCDALGDDEGSYRCLRTLANLRPNDNGVIEAFVERCRTPQRIALAIELYSNYLRGAPDSADGHYNFAYLLARAGKPSDAIIAYEKSLALGAERPEEILLNIATLYSQQLRDDVAAKSQLQRATSLNPLYVPAYYNLGCLAEEQGDRESACAFFSRCLELDAGYLPALARLADARNFEDEVDPLIGKLKTQATVSEDANLYFALGRALEQCGNYADALANFIKANSIDRSVYREYVPELVEAEFSAIKESFDCEWFEKNRLANDYAPIFICGMFRTGSTLVEQILAAHSAFTPGGEREFFSRLIGADLPEYPKGIELLSQDALHSWAMRYREESVRVFGSDSRLTDKRPDNFLYLGLIKTLFPKSKIIVTRRDSRDTAWSIYSTRFGPGQNYATDLSTIRHYIDLQSDLIAHWHRIFQQDLMTIDYEDLVTAPRETLADLLTFLEEPWEEQCLLFDKLKNTVRTESVWQVRKPLYTSSIGRSAPYLKLRPDLFV